MEIAKGMMVSANVRLTKPLGEGAMGCVWVAEHLTLDTEVAVKFISAHHAADPNLLHRFVQEAKSAAKIKSPHVVQTFDHGVMGDGTPYIVMELLDGESLQERVDRAGWLSLEESAQVITHVARALDKAHELGIVHRDIKPDNIFLTPTADGHFCKLLDFGIAKQTQMPKMGGLTNVGIMVGTPEFMSPEQVLSARDVDYRADLWGLAVTMYFVLTSRLPFTAEALGALCVKLLDGRFSPVTQHRKDLPEELDGWFKRSMASQPDDRFQSAREMGMRFIEIVSRSPSWRDPTQPLSYTPQIQGGVEATAAFPDALATPQPPYVAARSVATHSVAAHSVAAHSVAAHSVAAHSAASATIDATEAQEPIKASSETLTGSSAERRRDDRRWVGVAVVGAAVGVLGLVGIVALLATGDDKDATDVAAGPATSEEAPPAVAPPAPPSAAASTTAPEAASADPLEEQVDVPPPDAASSTPVAAGVASTARKVPSAPPGPASKLPKPADSPKPSDKKHYDHGF